MNITTKLTPAQRAAIRRDTRPSPVVADQYGIAAAYVRTLRNKRSKPSAADVNATHGAELRAAPARAPLPSRHYRMVP